MKKKLYDYLIRNWYWKLLALVAACLFWYAYVNIQDPVTTETLASVPVKVLHYEEFLAKGNHVEFEDSTLNIDNLTLNVTVRGRTSVLKELAEQKDRALYIWIDLYELDSDDDRLSIHYEISSNYRYSFNNVQFVTLYNQTYYAVNVDEDVTKTIPLEYIIVGAPSEDYVVIENDPNIILTPSEITLTGSQTELDEVETAQILASVEGLKANVALSEQISYYDAEGSRVYLSSDVKTSVDAATLYIPIYQTKVVPLEASIVGEAPEGYEYLDDATLSVSEVTVYGQESDLKDIEKIVLPEINISEYTGSATEVFSIEEVLDSLYPNGEVQYYSGSGSVRVTFTVAPVETREFTVPTDSITVNNLPDNRSLSFGSDDVIVHFSGTAAALDAFDLSTVKFSVDAGEAKRGSQYLQLMVNVPSGSKVVLDDAEIQIVVTITEEENDSE